MPRGGPRPGAGAPRGNTNAMKTGRYSPRMTGLLRELAQNRAFVWFVKTLRDMDLSDDEFKDLFRRATLGLPETTEYAAARKRKARRKARDFFRRWRASLGPRPSSHIGRAIFSLDHSALVAFRDRLLAGPNDLMQEAIEMDAAARRAAAAAAADDGPPPEPIPNGPEDEPAPHFDFTLPEPGDDGAPRRRSTRHIREALLEGLNAPPAPEGAEASDAPAVHPLDLEGLIRTGEDPRWWKANASPDDDFISMHDYRIDDALIFDDISRDYPLHPLTGVPVPWDRDEPGSFERCLDRIRKDLRRYQRNRERRRARWLGAFLRDHPDHPIANHPAIRRALQ